MSLHPSVYLAGNVLDASGLAKEVCARERLGLSSRYLNRRALHSDPARSRVVVEPGVLAGELDCLTQSFRMALPPGSCPPVGARAATRVLERKRDARSI
jgi:hypothetical protein